MWRNSHSVYLYTLLQADPLLDSLHSRALLCRNSKWSCLCAEFDHSKCVCSIRRTFSDGCSPTINVDCCCNKTWTGGLGDCSCVWYTVFMIQCGWAKPFTCIALQYAVVSVRLSCSCLPAFDMNCETIELQRTRLVHTDHSVRHIKRSPCAPCIVILTMSIRWFKLIGFVTCALAERCVNHIKLN